MGRKKKKTESEPKSAHRTLTHVEWCAEAQQRFGPDSSKWAFICPVCHYVATVADWKAAGAPEGAIAFSCVGRWMDEARMAFEMSGKGGPCNYAGGGLFRLNPVSVKIEGLEEPRQVFEFAPSPERSET